MKAHRYRLCIDIDTRFSIERYTNRETTMYPKIGSGATPPSAPTGPSTPLANSNAGKPVGFSSLVLELTNPGHSSSYSGGPGSQTPYPSGPPSSSYTNPYATNNPSGNAGSYSPYSLPQTGQQQMPPSQSEPSNVHSVVCPRTYLSQTLVMQPIRTLNHRIQLRDINKPIRVSNRLLHQRSTVRSYFDDDLHP